MVSSTKPINLAEISFPVYRLGYRYPDTTNGASVLRYAYTNKAGEVVEYQRVVDDTNQPGRTLAERRLTLLSDGVKLASIRKAIFFLSDLVKLAKPKLWFIDSNGLLFQYKKSTRVQLEMLEISKILHIATGGAIIEAKGYKTRFKTLYLPPSDIKYVGIIKYGMAKILYGLYREKPENTWRMI